jgi:pseudouridine synthase
MSEDHLERLQKFLARAGVASRRQSEELIREGRVTVNGRVVTQLGTKIDPSGDQVRVDGRLIRLAEEHVYIVLNKPRGVLSTMQDTRGRRALGDLVPVPARLYPVGRLDAASEGLILLTDDGDLANLLTHPRYGHDKEYRIVVNGRLSDETLESWRQGLVLDGKKTAPARVEVLGTRKDTTLLRVIMREGRKRQIRRVAETLGHPVLELTRTRLGPLDLGLLDVGQWRYLTAKEINSLVELKQRAQKAAKSPRRRQKGR